MDFSVELTILHDAKSRQVVHERLFKATLLPLIDLEREAA